MHHGAGHTEGGPPRAARHDSCKLLLCTCTYVYVQLQMTITRLSQKRISEQDASLRRSESNNAPKQALVLLLRLMSQQVFSNCQCQKLLW